MRILVVGGGGREHALVWRLQQCAGVTRIFCAPGNAGIALLADTVPIQARDVVGLVRFARENGVEFVVVGPEEPLALGLVDALAEAGILAFGPRQAAARLEASKAWAKELMYRMAVPTASFRVFGDYEGARRYVRSREPLPLVVKADGLCAGKGVTVCRSVPEVEAALRRLMVERVFGAAGERVILEEYLAGEEATVMAVTDGRSLFTLPPAQDHKALGDGDQGPNTGGMGAYAPAPVVTPELLRRVEGTILVPTLHGLAREGAPFRGLLYAGLMVTPGGPRVLEFNVRFGDPEAQVVLPQLEGDVLGLLLAAARGKLEEVQVSWRAGAAVCVVMASRGYPGQPEVGVPIAGLEEEVEGTVVFHAGTARRNGTWVTAGGRVLGVTGFGRDVAEARERAYRRVARIHFEGMHYRTDIAQRALAGKRTP